MANGINELETSMRHFFHKGFSLELPKELFQKIFEAGYDIPIFDLSATEEDRKVYEYAVESGIPCRFAFAAEEPTPKLRIGFQRYEGFDEIKEFIDEKWKKKGFKSFKR